MMWRNRILSASIVLAFTGLFMVKFSEPLVRAEYSYFFLMTLGYAHFLGGAVASRARMQAFVPQGVPAGLFLGFVGATLLTGFVAYVSFVQALGLYLYLPLFLPLLALALWHTVENDLGMQRAYAAGSFRIGPIPRDADHHLISIGGTLILLAVGIGTLNGNSFSGIGLGVDNTPVRLLAAACAVAVTLRGPTLQRRLLALGLLGAGLTVPRSITWLSFGDFFFITMLYHFVSWLILFADRAHANPAERWQLWRRLLLVHVPPMLVSAVLLHPALTQLRFILFMPVIYLFWSLAHITQTAILRRLETRDAGPIAVDGMAVR